MLVTGIEWNFKCVLVLSRNTCGLNQSREFIIRCSHCMKRHWQTPFILTIFQTSFWNGPTSKRRERKKNNFREISAIRELGEKLFLKKKKFALLSFALKDTIGPTSRHSDNSHQKLLHIDRHVHAWAIS